jgi:ribosome-associated protein
VTRHHRSIRIAGQSVEERFVRAAGPRGQNPRHQATAVELRLNVAQASLPEEAKARLLTLARAQMTKGGVLIVTARRSASQQENRTAARTRVATLLARAARRPARRLEGDMPQSAREFRLADKHRRSVQKRARRDQ